MTQWHMLKYLWMIKKQSKLDLIEAFIFKPGDLENMYEEEIKFFLDAISKKKKYPFTFKENHHYLKTMFALEKSSKSGKIIFV